MSSISLIDRHYAARAMRELGAISPETARHTLELPPEVRSDLDRLVNEGLIREGSPGTFYLFLPAQLPVSRATIVKTISFWVLVLLMPIALLWFMRR